MTEAIDKNIVNRLANLDRRVIYTALIIVLMLPIVHRFGFPLSVSSQTREVHDLVQTLKPGSKILVYSDMAAHTVGEGGPGWIAFIQDLMLREGVKIVFSSAGAYVPEPPTILLTQILPQVDTAGKTYGKDYVILGWTPGGETAMVNLARDIHTVYSTDVRGMSLEDLPALQGIQKVTDFDLVSYTGTGNEAQVFRQLFVPSGKPGVYVGLALARPLMMPYYPTVVRGYILGLGQAAEYETLLHKPGKATGAADSLDLGHFLMFGLLIIGNLAFTLQKRKEERSK